MESGGESRWAPIGRALRLAAVIDAALAAVVVGLCLLLGWTSRDEVMTVVLVTAAALVVAAGLGAGGTRVLPNTTPNNAAREALLLAPTMGPYESTRTMGLSTLLVLAALPFAAIGLALYATA
jgi:hypothetical protein